MATAVTIKGYPETKTNIKLPPVVQGIFEGSLVFARESTGTPKYTGQFGFDWMDLVTMQYHKVVGKNKYNATTEKYTFKPKTSASEFKKLEKIYDPFILQGYQNGLNTGNKKNDTKYYIPWLSLFKDKTCILSLSLDIKNHSDGIIKLKSSDANVLLSKKEISTKGKGVCKIDDTIKIGFKNAIAKHAKVEAKFYDDAGKFPKGILIGALNIYKNKFEYNLKVKCIKSFIKGSIKVEKETEMIVLDPISKNYKNYTDKIYELENSIKSLNKDLVDANSNPQLPAFHFLHLQSIQNSIRKEKKALKEIERQLALAKKIDKTQNDNLTASIKKVSDNKTMLENIFGQALVHYKNIETDNIEIEASDYKEYFDFTDDIIIYKHLDGAGFSDYKIKYIKQDYYQTGEFKQKTLNAYTNYKKDENYIILTSLNMHTSKTHNYNLHGSAESVSYAANKAMLLPMASPYNIIHEIGHLFNLYHTFNNSHINFCQGAIENIMDYPYFAIDEPKVSAKPITPKTTFFKWQWDIIKKDRNMQKKK